MFAGRLIVVRPKRGAALSWSNSIVVWPYRGVGLLARSPRNRGAVLLGR